MEPRTPEQIAQLSTWAGERDAILKEIAIYRTERDRLKAINQEISKSNTDIESRLGKVQVRIDELDKKEAEYNEIVGVKNAELEKEKTELESKVSSLKEKVSRLTDEAFKLMNIGEHLRDTHKVIFSKTEDLQKVVDYVTRVTDGNIHNLEALFNMVEKKVKRVVEVSEASAKQTEYIMSELPRVFFDVQRQSLDRKKIK
jgi:chromosome segregation ATPase